MSNYQIHLFPHQKDMYYSTATMTCLLAGRGSGKSYVASVLAVKSLIQGQNVFLFAQNHKAVSEVLFAEVIKRIEELNMKDLVKVNNSSHTIDYNGAKLYTFSYEAIDACRGYTGISTIIYDEICLAPRGIFAVAQPCQRGVDSNGMPVVPKSYLITTPRGNSWLKEYLELHSDVKVIRATSYDNKSLTKEQLDNYIGTIDKDMIEQEVMGEWVDSDDNSYLLKLSDIKFASDNDITDKNLYIGIDCSGSGTDNTCIVFRNRYSVLHWRKWKEISGFDMKAYVYQQLQTTFKGYELKIIAIDAGYGEAIYEQLHSVYEQAVKVPFAGSAPLKKYVNMRAYMYFKLKEALLGNFYLPSNMPDVVTELTNMSYHLVKDRLQLDPKEKLRLRIGRSPDLSDSLALTFVDPVVRKEVRSVYKEW